MADQSLVIFQKMVDRRDSEAHAVIGLSNSFVDNNPGSSGYRDSHELKSMDSTRIRGAEIIDTNQDHKKRCFEKLVVRTERMTKENAEDTKCSLQVEVIDDTALIEATVAVSGIKNSFGKETDVGYGNNPGKVGGSRNHKQENDGKKRRNKGSKKLGKACSMKCVKEKKDNQLVQDQVPKEKKIPERKVQNGFRKTYGKVKVVYQRKDSKVPILEEHQNLETEIPPENINIGDPLQEPASNVDEQEPLETVEAQTVKEKDEDETEYQTVCESSSVGLKKMAYSRNEIEALRFLDEDNQKNKWTEIFDGFSPSVAKEYTGLLAEMYKPQAQRYNNRVVNCGSSSTRHAILSMPPVLPLCSSSNYRKVTPNGRTGFRVNFP